MNRQRIDELYQIISEAQNEILQIKENCKHEDGYKIALYGDARMHIPQRLCNICDECMGDPTEEEWEAYERQERIKYLEGQGHSEEEIALIMDHR